MTTWQTIETAPKDGRHLLIYRLMWGGDIQQVCLWHNGKWCIWNDGRIDAIDDLGGVTHWQPLPAPPDA